MILYVFHPNIHHIYTIFFWALKKIVFILWHWKVNTKYVCFASGTRILQTDVSIISDKIILFWAFKGNIVTFLYMKTYIILFSKYCPSVYTYESSLLLPIDLILSVIVTCFLIKKLCTFWNGFDLCTSVSIAILTTSRFIMQGVLKDSSFIFFINLTEIKSCSL